MFGRVSFNKLICREIKYEKLCLFAVVLLVAGCASNGGYYDGGNLSKAVPIFRRHSQYCTKIKETKEEYRRYENEGDDYWKTEPESVGNSGVMTLNTKANG